MLISFFRVEGHVVQLDPEIYTIPEYATLAQTYPDQAQKLFSILYHLHYPGSPYYNKSKESALESLLNKFQVDKSIVESSEFKNAEREYYNSMIPFEIETIDAIKNQLNNMRNFMLNENMMGIYDKSGKPVYKPQDVTNMVNAIGDSFLKLEEIHDQVINNMNKNKTRVKGNKVPGMNKHKKIEMYKKYRNNDSKDKEGL